MERIEKECPRCKGERGSWSDGDGIGTWFPCITCRTQGKVKVSSMAEFRRLEHNVLHPRKAQTKQREKEKSNAK